MFGDAGEGDGLAEELKPILGKAPARTFGPRRSSIGNSGSALGSTGRELAPVEGHVGDEEVGGGEKREGQCQSGFGHVVVGGDEVQQAREDEVEGEGVGADHPLAVHRDLPVAGGDEGGEGAQEPEDRLQTAHEFHGEGEAAESERKGHGCSEADAADVDLAHQAVQAEVTLAEAAGELKRTKGRGEDSGDGVGDEQVAVGDELQAVGVVRVDEKGIVAVVEDGDSGEAEGVPEEMLGETAGAGASEWGGGSRHRGSDP